ncbi:MAG: Hpt domain-containing protein, partial [Candidatus Caenarcaniphilales bacterium]|nr:Hpt domain-containing protein [Candidatus Caenarcaniphilales bacterium]
MENNEDKVLFEFLDEAFFNINSFETSLLDLEKNVSDDNTIASMYRSLHTIKGALGFFSFKNLESLVHKTEDIFNHLQKIDQDELENLSFKKDLINLFFKVNDQIKNRLYSVKNKKTDDAKLDGQLIDELSKFNQFFLKHKKSNENKETKPKLSTLQQKVLEQLKQKSNDTNKINDNIEL